MQTTANGLTATAVRGVPNTWIVRVLDGALYSAYETDGTPISEVDTEAWNDDRWGIAGSVARTFAEEYDTPEEGRELAGWYVEVDHNAGEPYSRRDDALGQLKLQLRMRHEENAARAAARAAEAAGPVNTCGCGRPVSEHSKAERAALRAVARSVSPRYADRYSAAMAAYRSASPRTAVFGPGEVSDAAYHAVDYARPHTEGIRLVRVRPDGLVDAAMVSVGKVDNTVGAMRFYDGRPGDVEIYGSHLADPAAAAQRMAARYIRRGFVRAYDWS